MDKTSRALRRHHRARMFNRAFDKFYWDDDLEHRLWKVRRSFNNMANCSCEMCKNERHNGWNSKLMRLTMPERREVLRFQYELKEILEACNIYE